MKFRLHHPPLGPLGPMMYPPAGRGGYGGRYMLSRTQTNPPERIAQGGESLTKFWLQAAEPWTPPPTRIPPGTGGERKLTYLGRPLPNWTR